MYKEVQRNFYSIGIGRKLKPFNHRILSILAMTSLGVMSLWLFLFYEADSAEKYVESACVITICTSTLLSMASTSLTTKKLFLFIKAHKEYLNKCE